MLVFIVISLNTLNFAQGVGLIAMLISLYFSLHIFIKKYKRHNKVLSTYFFLFFLIQLFNFTYDIGLQNIAKYLIGIFIAARLCISPLLYCYIYGLTNNGNNPINIFRHLAIPIGIGIIETALIAAQNSFIEFTEFKESISSIVNIFTAFALFVAFISINIYYIYLSFNLLNKHRLSLGDYFTNEEGVGLKWIKALILGYLIFIITIFTTEIGFEDFPEWLYNIFIIIYLVFSGIKGLQQTEIFNCKNEVYDEKMDITSSEISSESNKYAQLYIRIVALIENDKLYLNQDLTIIDLSILLKVNSKYISQSIKQEYKNNFATFINSYRIEFAKKLLLDNSQENITIEGIAQMSGFKSKSVFNPFFKSKTGMTPKEYKDRVLIKSQQTSYL